MSYELKASATPTYMYPRLKAGLENEKSLSECLEVYRELPEDQRLSGMIRDLAFAAGDQVRFRHFDFLAMPQLSPDTEVVKQVQCLAVRILCDLEHEEEAKSLSTTLRRMPDVLDYFTQTPLLYKEKLLQQAQQFFWCKPIPATAMENAIRILQPEDHKDAKKCREKITQHFLREGDTGQEIGEILALLLRMNDSQMKEMAEELKELGGHDLPGKHRLKWMEFLLQRQLDEQQLGPIRPPFLPSLAQLREIWLLLELQTAELSTKIKAWEAIELFCAQQPTDSKPHLGAKIKGLKARTETLLKLLDLSWKDLSYPELAIWLAMENSGANWSPLIQEARKVHLNLGGVDGSKLDAHVGALFLTQRYREQQITEGRACFESLFRINPCFSELAVFLQTSDWREGESERILAKYKDLALVLPLQAMIHIPRLLEENPHCDLLLPVLEQAATSVRDHSGWLALLSWLYSYLEELNIEYLPFALPLCSSLTEIRDLLAYVMKEHPPFALLEAVRPSVGNQLDSAIELIEWVKSFTDERTLLEELAEGAPYPQLLFKRGLGSYWKLQGTYHCDQSGRGENLFRKTLTYFKQNEWVSLYSFFDERVDDVADASTILRLMLFLGPPSKKERDLILKILRQVSRSYGKWGNELWDILSQLSVQPDYYLKGIARALPEGPRSLADLKKILAKIPQTRTTWPKAPIAWFHSLTL